MENLDGKYFEKVISELKEMKAQEEINIDAQFRANLRAKIIERSMGVSNGFDWGSFVSKWKYVFGLVPTMAVMAIVAINMSNYQVKMKSVDYVGNAQPTNVVDNNNLSGVNNSVNEVSKSNLFVADKLPIESVDNNTPKIVTFSAELALPPVEVLLAHQNQQRSVEVSVQPKQENFSFQSNTVDLKINNPKLEVSNFVFGEAVPKNYVPNSFVPQVVVQPSIPVVTFVTKPVVNNTLNVQPAKIVPVNEVQVNPVQSVQNNIVQTPAVQAPVVQNVAIPVQPIVNANTSNVSVQVPAVLNEVNNVPLTIAAPKIIVPEAKVLSTPAVVNLAPTIQDFVNPVLESQQTMTRMMVAPVNGSLNSVVEAVSGSVQTDRIHYVGRNIAEVNSAILSNFANLNGGLSSDYYIDAVTLESGTIKVSLFEYGRVKRIVFLKEINGELRNVTEINY